jgi:hypothetical protein
LPLPAGDCKKYVAIRRVNLLLASSPAALHIAPAARLREFCLYDFALGELLCEEDGKFTDAACGWVGQ